MVVFSLDLETIIIILVVLLAIGAGIVGKSMIQNNSVHKENEELCYVADPNGMMGYNHPPRATGRFKHVMTDNGYVLHAEYEYWEGNAYQRSKEKCWQLANEDDMKLYYGIVYNE